MITKIRTKKYIYTSILIIRAKITAVTRYM